MTGDPMLAAVAEYERLDAKWEAACKESEADLKKALEAKKDAASSAASAKEEAILAMGPQTKEGAIALLEFVADHAADALLENREK